MKDILVAISQLREARGWTEYQLAENSGLPQSTISSWYRKRIVPTVPSLEKVCIALGITLSQLFSEGEDVYDLNCRQKRLIDLSCSGMKLNSLLRRFSIYNLPYSRCYIKQNCAGRVHFSFQKNPLGI